MNSKSNIYEVIAYRTEFILFDNYEQQRSISWMWEDINKSGRARLTNPVYNGRFNAEYTYIFNLKRRVLQIVNEN